MTLFLFIDKIERKKMDLIEYGEQLYYSLHCIPEESGKEYKTKILIQKICSKLKNFKCIYEGKHGLVYVTGSPINQKYMLGFRTELDALKMNNGEFFHGCGHDIHIASLLNFMIFLDKTKLKNNETSIFIFQSSEEEGNGARNIVNILKNKKIRIKNMFGLHNAPEIPVDMIAVKKGETLCNNFTNRIFIKTSQLIRFYSDIKQNTTFSFEKVYLELNILKEKYPNVLFSIGEFSSDGRVGVKPKTIEFSLSLRSNVLSIDELEMVFSLFIERVKKIPIVDDIYYSNINRHWRIKNSNFLCQELVRNNILKSVQIPLNFTSDDFCYYEYLSDELCYFFMGNYTSLENSKIHSNDFKKNEHFLPNSLKIYNYIWETLTL